MSLISLGVHLENINETDIKTIGGIVGLIIVFYNYANY